jgi:uncharacterized membrane protein YhfC
MGAESMNADPDMILWLVPGLGMILVAAAAVMYWRRVSRVAMKWFWVGAGLWIVAVVLKVICVLLTNDAVLGYLRQNLSYPLWLTASGLFAGIQSSFFEIGLTFFAVLVWRQLGQDAERAIAIGVGAGAFEAVLLGIASLGSVLAVMSGIAGTETIGAQVGAVAARTPLFWLVAPTERVIAILAQASSRALVLLGVTARKPLMIIGGIVIFTLLDSVTGVVHISGKLVSLNMWWVELALLPFGLVSLPILRWCSVRWGQGEEGRRTVSPLHTQL